MKFRKSQIAALLLIVLALVVGACMNTASPQATPAATADPFSGVPTATDVPAPAATVAPENQGDTGNMMQNDQNAQNTQNGAVAQSFDWNTNVETIENRIGQISEIAECRIVVSGDTALVGIRFTPQYKGEMTERIREMIAGQIKAADPALQTVAVTANEEDVDRIFEISDAVKAGQSVDELDSDIDAIIRNTTTMR